MPPQNTFFPLPHRSLIIFHNLKQCTVISRLSVLTCLSMADNVFFFKATLHPSLLPLLNTSLLFFKKKQKKNEPSWRLNNSRRWSSLSQIAGFRMKIDVGHSALLKSRTEITIQSDYPCPLIAADSMSQSGMCIINQWLLSAPPSSRSSYPFSSGLFSM